MDNINFIDLFSGCGGLTEGFLTIPNYKMVSSVDWELNPTITHRERLKSKYGNEQSNRILRFDIQRTNELLNGWKNDPLYKNGEGLNKLASYYNKIDLIIGGPPCQAYSVAGRIRDENGMQDDYRNFLFESYLKIVNHFKPLLFIFENVPGIMSACPGGIKIIQRITEAFEKIGYEICSDLRKKAIIDFSKYGVPQKRSRVIIIGINKKIVGFNSQELLRNFYENLLPKYKIEKIRTVKDAIFDLPGFFPSDNEYKLERKMYSHIPHTTIIPNHFPRYHNKRDIEIFHELAEDIEKGHNRYSTTQSLHNLYELRTGKKSSVHKYYVLRWNEPSNTIPAHLYKDGLRHIHPDSKQARSITVREAARLQTFGDDFVFFGSIGDQFKMIGNAVPPLFSEKLANAVIDLFSYIRQKEK